MTTGERQQTARGKGRRRQAVTIKHVAADAGVSLQTVSRVINNEPNVRAAMKERVQASIDRLGYVPSIAAQRMSGSRSYLLLALNDRDRTISDWKAREGRDWFDQMLLGGMLTCADRGYRLLIELVDTHSDHVERELGAVIAAIQPDGVILTPPHSENPQITGLLADRHIPFARIGSREAGPGFALTMGDAHNARLATDHLVALGHRLIGFIAGPEEFSLTGRRIAGWREAMEAAGLEHEGLCARGDFTYAGGLAAAQELLGRNPRPTAVIASSDQMAMATVDAARACGLTIPADLSVISFDNSPIMRFTNPPMTAIDQPIAATTARAVELLIDAHDGGESDAPIVIHGDLVVRESTGPVAVHDDR